MVWVFLGLCSLLSATPEPKFEAGHLEILQKGQESVMHFSQGVTVWMEGAIVRSLEAFYTESTGKGYLAHGVEMVLDSGRVTSDTLFFDENSEELFFVGRVHWVDSTREVFVDRARERSDTVFAGGNLRIWMPKQRIQILGDTALYEVQSAWAKVWGHAHMTLIREDTIQIVADTFRLEEDLVQAAGPVRITGRNLLGHAQFAWIQKNRIHLIEDASLIWDQGSLTGDTLVLEELSDSSYRVIAKQSSRLTAQEDQNSLTLTAQWILLEFVNDSLETVRAQNIQEGRYEERLQSEDKGPSGS